MDAGQHEATHGVQNPNPGPRRVEPDMLRPYADCLADYDIGAMALEPRQDVAFLDPPILNV